MHEQHIYKTDKLRRLAWLATIAAVVVAVALPSSAGAHAASAAPLAGYYSGPTTQSADQPYTGSVDFKVFKYGSFSGPVRKILKIGATTQLRCASGEVKEDRYLVYVILGGKINKRGAFSYAGNGFTMKGRFTTRTSATGTLSRTVGDCKAENVTWTAKRSTGGIPIP